MSAFNGQVSNNQGPEFHPLPPPTNPEGHSNSGSINGISIHIASPEVQLLHPQINIIDNYLDTLPPPQIHFAQPSQSNAPLRQEVLSPPETKDLIKKLSSLSIQFKAFNQKADRLKEDPDWKNKVKEIVSTCDSGQLGMLASMKEIECRGFDKEMLHEILSSAKETIEARGLPIDLRDLNKFIANLKDTVVINVPQENLVRLGGGAVNTVYSVTYPDPETGEPKTEVFKPDPADLDLKTQYKEHFFGTATASGIPSGENAHLTSRAVASSAVDRLLYPGDCISVNTRFAVVNGTRGIIMSKADGGSPKVKEELKREIINVKEIPKLSEYIDNIISEGRTLNVHELSFIASMLKFRSVEFQGDLKNEYTLTGISATFQNLNPDNVTTAEGLVKLQIKDYITGECDRHPGNYYIGNNGKVTGIDEDCCFGVNAVPEDVDVREQKSISLAFVNLIPNNASLMLHPPSVITQEIRDQVLTLQRESYRLVEALGPYVSREEINAALTRLNRLVEHIESENCLTVPTKNELLSEEAKRFINTNNSYWARELLVYSSDKKGWNHLREHRPTHDYWEKRPLPPPPLFMLPQSFHFSMLHPMLAPHGLNLIFRNSLQRNSNNGPENE